MASMRLGESRAEFERGAIPALLSIMHRALFSTHARDLCVCARTWIYKCRVGFLSVMWGFIRGL